MFLSQLGSSRKNLFVPVSSKGNGVLGNSGMPSRNKVTSVVLQQYTKRAFSTGSQLSTRLAGKKVFITAAGQGIGNASAVLFSQHGAEVIATDLDSSKLQSLETSLKELRHKNLSQAPYHLFPLDVTNLEDIQKISSRLPSPGAVDVLINCAGYVHNGTVLECGEKDWDFSFDINVKSMYRIIKVLLPAMIANGGGSIINIASVASNIKGVPNRFAYGASKAAVIGLTKALAADHIKQGIRCNAICPGTIYTPSLVDRINSYDDPKEAEKNFISRQPMGRLGKAEEIAQMALYLGDHNASAFTTGTVMVVDGGFTL